MGSKTVTCLAAVLALRGNIEQLKNFDGICSFKCSTKLKKIWNSGWW